MILKNKTKKECPKMDQIESQDISTVVVNTTETNGSKEIENQSSMNNIAEIDAVVERVEDIQLNSISAGEEEPTEQGSYDDIEVQQKSP